MVRFNENTTTNREVNILASDLASAIYCDKLAAFQETMKKFNVPACYYSLLSVKEQAVCLEYRNGKWVTYTSERGQEYDLEEFGELDDALISMLKMFAESDSTFSSMVKDYYHGASRNYSAKLSEDFPIFEIIQKSYEKISHAAAIL